MSDHPDAKRDLWLALGVFLAALGARLGYLVVKGPLLTADACYYYAVARSLEAGRGFTVAYVWHYLAGIPPRLPAPSNDYWTPLSSIAQAGALKAGGVSVAAASMPGIIAGAALAAWVFWLTRELFASRAAGLLAASMWTVSAHLVALSVSPDCFMVAALLTSLGLYAIHRSRGGHLLWAAGAGALAGLAYLARADGLLVAATFALVWAAANRRSLKWRPLAAFAGALILVAAPWWARNYLVLGAPLGAPAAKTAFLATYNDIFRLDTSSLTLSAYLGLNQTLQSLMKGYVVWRELRLLAVMCGLALPAAVWTVVMYGRRRGGAGLAPLSPWLIHLALAVAVTSLVFPYPALKGTFWHLAPGLCVFILAAGAAAIAGAAGSLWRRGLPAKGAAVGLLAAAVGPLVAWYAFTPSHSEVDRSPYRQAAGAIALLQPPVQVALTDDAWSLHHFSGLRCAQAPTDGPGAVLRVADALGANYLLLRERTLRNVASLGAVRRYRRFEPVAVWGAGPDAVHAYRIMPFAAAERIAKSHNARGMALAAEGRYPEAVTAFEEAASYKPDFAPIIANIALACWQAGRPDEARLRALQALSLDPDNATAARIAATGR